MPGELARYITSTAVERAHARALDRIERKEDLANAEVFAVTHVATNAIQGTSIVCAFKQQAAFQSPEDAGLFSMIATTAAVEMTQAIRKVTSRTLR